MKYYYHYTSKEGVRVILSSLFIRESKEDDGDAVYGSGRKFIRV